MTAIAAQEKNLAACLAISRTVDGENFGSFIDAWLAIFLIRRLMPSLVCSTRNLDLHGEISPEKMQALYRECVDLRDNLARLEKDLGWTARWLLKKPYADLDDLCVDFALVTDPEARELLEKIAAASA